MGEFKQKLNIRTGQFNLVPTANVLTFKESVPTAANLPLVGNTENDARITDDTHNLFIWDGSIWIDQGDIIDLKWEALEDKPTSLVVDIDDAVAKKHTQNSDTQLKNGVVSVDVNDTTKITQVNNFNAVQIDNYGTSDGALINQLGVLANNKHALRVYSDEIQLTSSLVKFVQNSQLSTKSPLEIYNRGTGKDITDGSDGFDIKDVQDAVTVLHVQGTDQKLDEGGVNEVAVADIKDAVTKRHDIAVPGGADTQVQFNDGGSFSGDSTLTYNKTTNVLSVKKLSFTNTTSSWDDILIANQSFTIQATNVSSVVSTLYFAASKDHDAIFSMWSDGEDGSWTHSVEIRVNTVAGRADFDCSLPMALRVSGDFGQFIQLQTITNIPEITTVGDCDLKISSSSGRIAIVGNTEIDGELKIKVYSQPAEPTLGADQRCAYWIDTDDSDKVYLIFRRGSGDQVTVELA